MAGLATLAFGGGCHWCTEAVFASLRGTTVTQGFAGSDPPDEAMSEAALVEHDEAVIPLSALVAVHLRTHAAGSDHAMRGKYRSAVYTTDEAQAEAARAALAAEADALGPLVTRVLPLRAFEPSRPEFRRYYETRGPEAPFCRAYIDPKLARVRREFGRLVREEGAG